jgi:hypothetical protein
MVININEKKTHKKRKIYIKQNGGAPEKIDKVKSSKKNLKKIEKKIK